MGDRAATVKGLRAAVCFLTRVPLGTGTQDIAASVPWFPTVGALIGLAVALVFAAGMWLVPAGVAAVLAVGAGIALTGAFHEDGLGDVADAFVGGRDRDDVARILKDPRHGTYGVAAIVVSIAVRAACLASLTGWSAAAALVAAHALSRAAAVGLMGTVSAVPEGLGASYTHAVGVRQVLLAVTSGVLVAAAAIGVWTLPALLLCALAASAIGRIALKKLGGISGDALGAVQQACEISVMVLASAVEANAWPQLAWWHPFV
jgi:adenosylcobinamide-GDP ribazoletransferase